MPEQRLDEVQTRLEAAIAQVDEALDLAGAPHNGWGRAPGTGSNTAGLALGSDVNLVGLCHSVQMCVPMLLGTLGRARAHPPEEVSWDIAGINHQAWLLRIEHEGRDLYPEIKATARELVTRVRERGSGTWARELLAQIGMPDEEPCYMHPVWAQRARRAGKIDRD